MQLFMQGSKLFISAEKPSFFVIFWNHITTKVLKRPSQYSFTLKPITKRKFKPCIRLSHYHFEAFCRDHSLLTKILRHFWRHKTTKIISWDLRQWFLSRKMIKKIAHMYPIMVHGNHEEFCKAIRGHHYSLTTHFTFMILKSRQKFVKNCHFCF